MTLVSLLHSWVWRRGCSSASTPRCPSGEDLDCQTAVTTRFSQIKCHLDDFAVNYATPSAFGKAETPSQT